MSWVINACRNETRGVTGLQRAGGRGCAVTIFKRIDRSFLEKLTLEQRFEEVRELHMDILRKDVPVRARVQPEQREGAAELEGLREESNRKRSPAGNKYWSPVAPGALEDKTFAFTLRALGVHAGFQAEDWSDLIF